MKTNQLIQVLSAFLLKGGIIMFDKFYREYNIKVPEGILFYPGAGEDTLEPIELFGGLVDKLVFADIREITLPDTNCEKVFYNSVRNRYYSGRTKGEIEKGIVEEVHIKTQSTNIDIGNAMFKYFDMDIGSVRTVNNIRVEDWYLYNKDKIKINTFNNDGFLSLLNLTDISVFFYRGDSQGEGGSGQWWFSPQVFKVLTSRLTDGAIIITDGANFHPSYKMVSWSPLRDRENRQDFPYNDMYFEYIGEREGYGRSCGIWRVLRRNRK